MKSELKSTLEKYRKSVDRTIKELLALDIDNNSESLINYQISTGGKRLRSALAITCCQLLDGKVKDVLTVAASLEILHNYSLIFDDVIDGSQIRRQKPTLWRKFGTSIAECVAVDYGVTVFQGANRSKEPQKISEILAKTMKKIVDGEILDILFEQNGRVNEPYIIKNRYKKIAKKEYFKMVKQKTSALFQACCEIGGICAGATERQIFVLRNFGLNLGIAFQIRDDYLDIFGGRDQEPGKDIKERKLGNFVLLLAIKKLSSKDKNKILSIMKKKNISQRDIVESVKIINQTKSGKEALKVAEKYVKAAQNNLLSLPKNKWNNFLAEIADFVINREK